MRCKQIRQHKQRPEKQVYEIWSNQVRRNRPNLINRVRSEKLTEIPAIGDLNQNWGIAQPR
ncbi:MAG: hypothetical protein Kow00121_01580 [Elainellaceae cyanobacterium]